MRPDNLTGEAHFRALERLYGAAPINQLFQSSLHIPSNGTSRITFTVTDTVFHAGGAAHGSAYFKMLDDAAFYAANTHCEEHFLLTTNFNVYFTKPVRSGEVIAEGKWVSGKRRVFVAESRLLDAEGDEIGRGSGTFMRSRIQLATLEGYSA
ncbi:MAG: PaaI family thioesterase [Pseudomonadota bacterium]